jgi:hypothetical protein
MTRIGSQLTFCSPQQILRRMLVERDDQNYITGIHSLDNSLVETAQTLFFDGIISTGIISLKQNRSTEEIQELSENYIYCDLSEEFPAFEIGNNSKPLVCDFGTNALDSINIKLEQLARANSELPIFELIASCVYYPALLLGEEAELKPNSRSKLLLWEKTDLVNKTLTINTKIREV